MHPTGLIVAAPEPLRSELRLLTRGQLLKRVAAVRPDRHCDVELRGTLQRCAASPAASSN
jgi:hypothetical protein